MSTRIENTTLITLADREGYGQIDDGAMLIVDGRIAFVGPRADCPVMSGADIVDGDGRYCYPGLIDCHTHLVFAGDRSAEFAQRLGGAAYTEIAAAGGGIAHTVQATRRATEAQLFELALPRAQQLAAEGVRTLEIKSGYGLTLADEAKMLRVAGAVGAHTGQRIVRTFLGLHALPPEFTGRRDDYVQTVAHDWLPALHAQGLVDQVDAFCEGVGFSRAEVEVVLRAALALGLPIKLHAEQLSDQGGTRLIAQLRGLSADHVEYLAPVDIPALAQAGSVAVLLPGAYYVLRETMRPPVAALRAHGVPIAVATDLNPGTSPLRSLKLAMNMACVLFGLTVEECWRGVTINAARALGLEKDIGSLEVGKAGDYFISPYSPLETLYWLG